MKPDFALDDSQLLIQFYHGLILILLVEKEIGCSFLKVATRKGNFYFFHVENYFNLILHWVSQKIHSDFCDIIQKNLNEHFGQPNICVCS